MNEILDEEIKSGESWINSKNQKQYNIKGFVRNATNAQSGQVMVLYQDLGGWDFVRERNEFLEKFTKKKL